MTGHVLLVRRKTGPKFYVKYRTSSGRQVKKLLGPAWTQRSRPPAGHLTRSQAEAELRQLMLDAGRLPDREAITFREAADAYLRHLEHDRQREPKTVRDARNTINRRLAPALGADRDIAAITADDLDSLRQQLLAEKHYRTRKPLARRTVQKAMVIAHGVFAHAARRRWIAANPAAAIERVNVKRTGDFNVLSVPEVEAVARAASTERDSAVIRTAAYTGLRMGELRALRWQDIDFAAATVLVRRSFTVEKAKAPKSGHIRSVPLIDQAAAALDQLSRRGDLTDPDDLVFPSPTGYFEDGGILREAFYTALRDAGYGHLRDPEREPHPFRFHDLRHTFGTLAARTWPLPEVQAYMGHADIQTTMIYIHHVPRTTAAAELTAAVAAAAGTEPGTELADSAATERN